MTDVDMFVNYKGKIKILKEKIKAIHKGSYDLEQIIERQNREINTLKQIIDLQAKKIEQDRIKNVPKC
jgi:prefoldin subunit 5